MRLRFGASGAKNLCTLGATTWRFCAPLSFTVRPHPLRTVIRHLNNAGRRS